MFQRLKLAFGVLAAGIVALFLFMAIPNSWAATTCNAVAAGTKITATWGNGCATAIISGQFWSSGGSGSSYIRVRHDGTDAVVDNNAGDIRINALTGQEIENEVNGTNVLAIGGAGITASQTLNTVGVNTVKTTEQLRTGYDTSNYFSTTVGSTGATVFDAVGSGSAFNLADRTRIGAGVTNPTALLHLIGKTEQQRTGYDTSNYYSTTVGSTGLITFNAVGSGSAFNFSDVVTASVGINVGNTAVAAANTLEWYEEGTFTPVVAYETPGTSSLTHAIQVGSFTRIGRIVHFYLQVSLSGHTIGTGSGAITVTGLPYAAASTANLIQTGPIAYQNITAPTGVDQGSVWQIVPSGQRLLFVGMDNGTTALSWATSNPGFAMSATSMIRASGSYVVP